MEDFEVTADEREMLQIMRMNGEAKVDDEPYYNCDHCGGMVQGTAYEINMGKWQPQEGGVKCNTCDSDIFF